MFACLNTTCVLAAGSSNQQRQHQGHKAGRQGGNCPASACQCNREFTCSIQSALTDCAAHLQLLLQANSMELHSSTTHIAVRSVRFHGTLMQFWAAYQHKHLPENTPCCLSWNHTAMYALQAQSVAVATGETTSSASAEAIASGTSADAAALAVSNGGHASS